MSRSAVTCPACGQAGALVHDDGGTLVYACATNGHPDWSVPIPLVERERCEGCQRVAPDVAERTTETRSLWLCGACDPASPVSATSCRVCAKRGRPCPDHEHAVPWRTLSEQLAEMERTDPEVAAAAEQFEQTKQSIIEDRSHPLPCQDRTCRWHHDG